MIYSIFINVLISSLILYFFKDEELLLVSAGYVTGCLVVASIVLFDKKDLTLNK